MSKLKLEELFLSRKHIAVQFYWHFWKTLSHRIREANELLKSFFIEASKAAKERQVAAGANEGAGAGRQNVAGVLAREVA